MQDKTNLIFIHKVLKAFADSIIKVFIPLLIYKATLNMMLVFLYLSLYYAFGGLFNFLFKKFLQKYGVIAIILHTIPIISMQFLFTLEITWYICVSIALLASLAQVLYSVPINLLFAFSDKKVNVGKFQISTNIGKIVFTILSGYVIGSTLQNSIWILAGVGSALYLLSVIPIWYGYDLLKSEYIKVSSRKEKAQKGEYTKFHIFHGCFGMFQSVLDIFIPLYLYINNLTFEAVAIVVALIEVCKIGANLFANFLVKKDKRFLSNLIGGCCFLMGCIVILIVKVPVILYICSCLIAISFPLTFVPAFSTFCKKVSKQNTCFNQMVYRDVVILGARPLGMVPYFVLQTIVGQFCIGMACSITMLFVSRKIYLENKNK